MIVASLWEDNTAVGTPTGWTNVTDVEAPNTTTARWHIDKIKFSGTPPTSVTWSYAGANGVAYAWHIIRGVDTVGTLTNVTDTTSTSASNYGPTNFTVTAGTGGAVVFALMDAVSGNSGASNLTNMDSQAKASSPVTGRDAQCGFTSTTETTTFNTGINHNPDQYQVGWLPLVEGDWATVHEQDSATSGVDGTSHTFNGLNVGPDGGDDIIYILAGSRTTSGATTVTCTVDGTSATQIVHHVWNEAGSIYTLATIFAISRNDLTDPSQTDVDVVITYNASVLRFAVAVAVSPDAVATATATATNDADGGNLNLNTDTDGIVIACAFQGDTDTFTWTGLFEVTDTTIETGTFGTAYASNISGESPRSVDVIPDINSDLHASVAASFAYANAAAGNAVGDGLTNGILLNRPRLAA